MREDMLQDVRSSRLANSRERDLLPVTEQAFQQYDSDQRDTQQSQEKCLVYRTDRRRKPWQRITQASLVENDAVQNEFERPGTQQRHTDCCYQRAVCAGNLPFIRLQERSERLVELPDSLLRYHLPEFGGTRAEQPIGRCEHQIRGFILDSKNAKVIVQALQ